MLVFCWIEESHDAGHGEMGHGRGWSEWVRTEVILIYGWIGLVRMGMMDMRLLAIWFMVRFLEWDEWEEVTARWGVLIIAHFVCLFRS